MIDTHCHLTDQKYENEIESIIENFTKSKVDFVVTVGCDHESNIANRILAEKYANVYYTVGIHPEACTTDSIDDVAKFLDKNDPKLVAVGEIGLDYYYTKDNKEEQIKVFIEQIELAQKYNKPIIIHCRDAYGDMLEILKRYAPFNGKAVMHCYSGSLEFAREIIKLGVLISFTGSVTFKNAHNLQLVAREIPVNKFFFETDSPYMSPEPMRGKRNEPMNVWRVAEFVANLRGVELSELIKITDNTAREFYGIND